MSIRQTIRQTLRASTIRETLLGEGGVNTDFVMVFATTGASETLTIPCTNAGTFNATINWGDGEADSTITAYNDADLAHVYADAGDHTVTISGTFPNIFFSAGGDRLKLKEITNIGDTGLVMMASSFLGCSNLTSVTSSYTNTPLLTNLRRAFRDCVSATQISVSSLDTAAVTDMSEMLMNTPLLTDAAIDGLNIGLVTTLTDFITGWALPTSRYNATLIAWEAQSHQSTVTAGFGTSLYSGKAAADARQRLIDDDLWVITDSGIDPTPIGVTVGDSFANDATDWPGVLSTGVDNYATAGHGLVNDIEPAYAGHISARAGTVTFSIIQGGVNDITGGKTLAQMKTATTSMVSTATAALLDVGVIGLSPWAANASWDAAGQIITDDYNAWLAAQASVQGFTYIDMYAALEGGTADELSATYDNGDGLHPNTAGMQVIADLVDTAIAGF